MGVQRAGGSPVVIANRQTEATNEAPETVQTNRGWSPPEVATPGEVVRIAPRREPVVAGNVTTDRRAELTARADDRFARDLYRAGARNTGELDAFVADAGRAAVRHTLDSPGASGQRRRDALRDLVPAPVQAGLGAAVVGAQLANGERIDVLNTSLGPIDVNAETNFRGDDRFSVGTTLPVTREVGVRVRAETDGDENHGVRAELVLRR
ncbi:MAG: hypothetical protein JNK82_14225 [Myxococcaceae bacterium]|nr:hypothetical protein [Myxococcaceae bacterium]